jgi:hypothetical protein
MFAFSMLSPIDKSLMAFLQQSKVNLLGEKTPTLMMKQF